MISSHDGTDERRDRPPAAFLTGRSRVTAGAASGCSGAGRARPGGGTRTRSAGRLCSASGPGPSLLPMGVTVARAAARGPRSEEHTSELQSHHDLVCRLLLEKKKQQKYTITNIKKKTQKHKQ